MPFVQAKCENCGGFLTVDSSLKAANCPHCGAAYVVQDAINYYHSVTNVGHLHANVVNVANENSADGKIRAAEAFMQIGQSSKAKQLFQQVTEIAPQDYRAWWGLLKCSFPTPDYYKADFVWLINANSLDLFRNTLSNIEDELKTYAYYYNNFKTFAPLSAVNNTRQQWNAHLEGIQNNVRTVEQRLPQFVKAYNEKHDSTNRAKQSELNAVDEKIKVAKAKIEELEARLKALDVPVKSGLLDGFFYHNDDTGVPRTFFVLCFVAVIWLAIFGLLDLIFVHKGANFIITGYLVCTVLSFTYGVYSDIRHKINMGKIRKQREAEGALRKDIREAYGKLRDLERDRSNIEYKYRNEKKLNLDVRPIEELAKSIHRKIDLELSKR